MNPKQRRLRYFAYMLAMSFPAFAVGQSPPAELPRIGLLAWSSCDEPSYARGRGEFGSFRRGLDELGYRPGKTVSFECRSAGERYDGLAAAAADLARLPVAVIVTNSQPAGRAAHEATKTVPIVTVVSGDPVAAGLARSLGQPGGNLTGVSYYATELTAKRLELLQELNPQVARVDILANPDVSYLPFEEDTKQAASRLGLTLRTHQVRDRAGLAGAFARMKAEGAQAVFVLPDVMFAWSAEQIAALALEHRLPTMAWGSWFAEVGCLMAYSGDYGGMSRRLASYVDRILKGARPGELPIEQPTAFALSINLKTAKALGIDVAPSLLARADEVIE
jgi:putative ABC transport system substrate-binding protein